MSQESRGTLEEAMTVLLGRSEEWKGGSLHFVCVKMKVLSGQGTILGLK